VTQFLPLMFRKGPGGGGHTRHVLLLLASGCRNAALSTDRCTIVSKSNVLTGFLACEMLLFLVWIFHVEIVTSRYCFQMLTNGVPLDTKNSHRSLFFGCQRSSVHWIQRQNIFRTEVTYAVRSLRTVKQSFINCRYYSDSRDYHLNDRRFWKKSRGLY
jgi:hypothetical protein